MSEAMLEKLNEAERTCVDHLRQARVLGVSLAEYCRSFDLDLSKWYRVKQALARKGVIVGLRRVRERTRNKLVFHCASRHPAPIWKLWQAVLGLRRVCRTALERQVVIRCLGLRPGCLSRSRLAWDDRLPVRASHSRSRRRWVPIDSRAEITSRQWVSRRSALRRSYGSAGSGRAP